MPNGDKDISRQSNVEDNLLGTPNSFQSFQISYPNIVVLILGYTLTIALVLFAEFSGCYDGLRFYQIILAILVQSFVSSYLVILLANLFRIKQTVQLFKNKLIIIGRETETIPFSEVGIISPLPVFDAKYGGDSIWSFYYPVSLVIKLKNGKRKWVSGNNKDMIKFLNTIETQLRQPEANSNYNIERLEDKIPDYVVKIMIALGFTIIVLGVLYLFFHNSFKPDYR